MREVVVVQLVVNKAFDHVDHRAAFKAIKLQSLSPFSMALMAAIWNGSCMKARLGTNKVLLSCGFVQGAPESPVIFTMIMELVVREMMKSSKTRKLAWSSTCYADDVVLVAAAEVMVAEVFAELKEVGLSVDESPEDGRQSIVYGLAVFWEEVLEFDGSKVCFEGHARFEIARRSAQANKCSAK